MRLSRLSPLLLVPLLPQVNAHHKPPVHTAIAQRQWKPRDLIDICVDLSAVAGLASLLGVDVELCLCLKDLDLFLETNVNVKSDALGLKTALEALLRPLFDHGQHCRPMPSHAHRACKSSDPCHFDCDPGYILVGTQCVCDGCSTPSPTPRLVKSRADTVKVSVGDLLHADVDIDSKIVGTIGADIRLGSTSPAPPSDQPPSCPPPTNHDGLLALLHDILVQVGPGLQGLLQDLGTRCKCHGTPAGVDPSSSLAAVVNWSLDLGSVLASLETDLSHVNQLSSVATRLVADVDHCLGLDLDHNLADLLNHIGTASRVLLRDTNLLQVGLTTCGCTEQLLSSLLKDLHLTRRCDPAIAVTLPNIVDAQVNAGALDRPVLDVGHGLGLEPILHPARAYPIRRDLLSANTPTPTSHVEANVGLIANVNVGLGSTVSAITHKLGLDGLIYSSTSSSAPATVDALVKLVAHISTTTLHLYHILDSLGSTCQCRDIPPGSPTSDPKALINLSLGLGADINTSLNGLSNDLSLVPSLLTKVGQLTEALLMSLVPGIVSEVGVLVKYALVDTGELLHSLGLLKEGLDKCGCVDELAHSLVGIGHVKKVDKRNRFSFF
ncbi:hypothetical protein VKT23_020076 [Stygiomarasmius scandens]|uniref:Uncharacterized protein n=1 Tax=Marasmiellus scandens TaxID=2682957 RepID=A0ABR1IL52_9AGAR